MMLEIIKNNDFFKYKRKGRERQARKAKKKIGRKNGILIEADIKNKIKDI
jgi:hypothetical protein